MLKAIVQKLRAKSVKKSIDSFDIATEEDLYYCYRLLLHRTPDHDGFSFWKQLENRGYQLFIIDKDGLAPFSGSYTDMEEGSFGGSREHIDLLARPQ